MTAYTILIARAMSVDPKALHHIARGAFLHDIGKMGIPDSILGKPGPLTDEERLVMGRHCEIGYQALRNISFLQQAADIVLTHQEHFDGRGYPKGLRGEAIPLGARILAVADAFDAMISNRPYRKAMPIDAAREEIRRYAGTQFDPRVAEVFLSSPEDIWLEYRHNPAGAFRLADIGKSAASHAAKQSSAESSA